MDHGDGCDHFHHSCSRYIHRLPKVSKVGIYCGYYLYHDLVTVQEKVIHKIMDQKIIKLNFNTFATRHPFMDVCKMRKVLYICSVTRAIL